MEKGRMSMGSSFLDRPEAEAARPRTRRSILWLLQLFFKPAVFFSGFRDFATPFSVTYASVIVGLAEAIAQLSEEAMKRDFGSRRNLATALLDSWALYWASCLGLGLIGAVLYYKIGGWWYRVRLEWSGETSPDRRLARQVYIFASLVLALPVTLFTVLDTFRFPTPLAAERGNQWWWIPSALLPFWSVYTSYRGVRTLFQTACWKARVWFLVLPSLFYLILYAGMIGAGILVTIGVLAMPPDVNRPGKIERPGFGLRYPGNWWVNVDEDGYDPDGYFSIEPMQDAVVTFFIAEQPADPVAETRSFLEDLGDILVNEDVARFDRWGRLAGSGVEFTDVIEGVQYGVRIFSSSTTNRSMTVIEFAAASAADAVEPGLVLIRDSFHFKE